MSKHGGFSGAVRHWVMQRLSAVGLLFLSIWLVWGIIIPLSHTSYEGAILLLSSISSMTCLLLFMSFGFYHAFLGIQVVIEDYIHSSRLRIFLLAGLSLFCIGMASLSLISILRIAFFIAPQITVG